LFCGAALLGAFSFSGRVMRQRGQVLSFDSFTKFGMIMSETGKRHFFSGYDEAESVAQNDWVEFSSKPNIMSVRSKIHWVAEDVQRINFSADDLIHGTIVEWFPDKVFGFIDYDGQIRSAFFHIKDLL
jgi:cold shock CspA family protein